MATKKEEKWNKWLVIKLIEANTLDHALNIEGTFAPVEVRKVVSEKDQLVSAIGVDVEVILEEDEDDTEESAVGFK